MSPMLKDIDTLMHELALLDETYAESDRTDQVNDAAWRDAHPGEDPPEDEMELLRRAGLNRGQP